MSNSIRPPQRTSTNSRPPQRAGNVRVSSYGTGTRRSQQVQNNGGLLGIGKLGWVVTIVLSIVLLVFGLLLGMAMSGGASNTQDGQLSLVAPQNIQRDESTISWDNVNGADQYVVFVYTYGQEKIGNQYIAKSNKYDLTAASLNSGELYTIRIKSRSTKDEYQDSGFSDGYLYRQR